MKRSGWMRPVAVAASLAIVTGACEVEDEEDLEPEVLPDPEEEIDTDVLEEEDGEEEDGEEED